MQTIGVLGGMGPVATVEFLQRVLERCQREHAAVQDGEYPPMLVSSLSLKGSDETGIRDETVLAAEFVRGIRRLVVGGCDFVVIPCNTAHEFVAGLQREIPVPILSIIALTVREIERRGFRRVGLLASESTLADGLYARPLRAHGIVPIDPSPADRAELTQLVLHVMGGRPGPDDRRSMQGIVERLRASGPIDAIIVGCTELSLVQPTESYSVPAIDAMDVLAEATVEAAYSAAPPSPNPVREPALPIES